MLSNFDLTNVPQRTPEEWQVDLQRCPWGNPKIAEPRTFTTSFRSRTDCYGLELGAIKHGYDPRHAYSIVREHKDVRSDGIDNYRLFLQAAGSATYMQNDQVAELAPGDAVLVDTTRPSVIANHGGLLLDLVLPRSPLTSRLGLELQSGLRSPRGTAAGRALRQMISDAGESPDMSDWANGQMRQVIQDLIAVLFEPKFDSSKLPDALYKKVCGIIRDSHTDPDLTPTAVAAEAGMSLRKLQEMFTRHGTTCTEHIHSVRLEHALFLLRRRSFLLTNELLYQISWACGYRDYHHFARVFRRRFGQSPRAFTKSNRVGA